MKDMWSRLLGVVQRHLTRPRRIVLDLVLTAVLLGVLWWWYDYPLPMGPEGQLRRMERRELLQPGEIVYTLPRERGRREPASLTRELVVSMGEDWAALGWLGGREWHSYLAEFSGTRMPDGAMEQVERAAREVQSLGAQNVLVSMGKTGAALLEQDGTFTFAPAPEGKSVNTIGAGDAMVAGFLGALEMGCTMRRALDWGLAAGTAYACVPWMPTKQQIEALLPAEG